MGLRLCPGDRSSNFNRRDPTDLVLEISRASIQSRSSRSIDRLAFAVSKRTGTARELLIAAPCPSHKREVIRSAPVVVRLWFLGYPPIGRLSTVLQRVYLKRRSW
jgi:hypothetical protein